MEYKYSIFLLFVPGHVSRTFSPDHHHYLVGPAVDHADAVYDDDVRTWGHDYGGRDGVGQGGHEFGDQGRV